MLWGKQVPIVGTQILSTLVPESAGAVAAHGLFSGVHYKHHLEHHEPLIHLKVRAIPS